MARAQRLVGRTGGARLAGGRWLILVGRALLWALVALLLVRGVVSLTAGDADAGGQAPRADPSQAFPAAQAQAFAARFAADYATYDSDDPSDRQERLAAYLPPNGDDTMGWDGRGTQRVLTTVPVSLDATDPRTAVVTVAVRTNNSRWLHLAVPVVADGPRRLTVAGEPALVPGPQRAPVPQTEPVTVDVEAVTQVTETLEAFFRAYAGGEGADLSYYSPPGVRIADLGGIVTFSELAQVMVPRGGPQRTATAEVGWVDTRTRASYSQTYAVDITQIDGRWYVERLDAVRPLSATTERQAQ